MRTDLRRNRNRPGAIEMIKRFCDICGNEITDSNSAGFDNPRGRLSPNVKNGESQLRVEVITEINGTANSGDVCKHCDECKHGCYQGQIGETFVCKLGHKPRFYKPAGWDPYGMHSDWGWKRRCDDFNQIPNPWLIRS